MSYFREAAKVWKDEGDGTKNEEMPETEKRRLKNPEAPHIDPDTARASARAPVSLQESFGEVSEQLVSQAKNDFENKFELIV